MLTEHLTEQNKIRVIYAEDFDNHPEQQDIINRIFEIHKEYHNLWVFCDGSNRGAMTSLKIAFGEDPHYDKVEDVSPSSNKLLPVAFNRDHKQMISHLVSLFEDDYIGIAEKYDKLIISLKTAYVNEYALDKEATSYSDSFDALRLSLKCFNVN